MSQVATFHIPALDCPEELALIERSLRGTAGLVAVSPDYLSRSLRVEFDPASTQVTLLLSAIQRAGFPAQIALPVTRLRSTDVGGDGKYVTTHLMVAKKFLDANPEVVKRILAANLEAIDEVNTDPAAAQATANAEIEKYTTKALGADLLSAAWKNLSFTADPIASSLQKSADDAMALGLLKDPGDLSGLYDLTLLNELLAADDQQPVQGL